MFTAAFPRPKVAARTATVLGAGLRPTRAVVATVLAAVVFMAVFMAGLAFGARVEVRGEQRKEAHVSSRPKGMVQTKLSVVGRPPHRAQGLRNAFG